MPANKKPRKKYVPINTRAPNIINQQNTFDPFEKALDKLITTGEVDVDSIGNYIFKDNAGKIQQFASSLKVYIELMDLYCKKNNLPILSKPFSILQNRMYEGLDFYENEIQEAKKCLNICREIVCKMTQKELLKHMETIRIAMKIEQKEEGSLKNPEMLLAKCKYRIGELTYEEVIEKNKIFRELCEKEPENDRYKKLRDAYLEYFAAYRFVRIEEKRKVIKSNLKSFFQKFS